MSMTALPQDVFDYVIDVLRDDPRALRTCALVCRDWLHRSRVHLFSKITIPCSMTNPLSPVLSTSPLYIAAINSFLEQVCAHICMIDFLAHHFTQVLAETADAASRAVRAHRRAAELDVLLDNDPELADDVHVVTVNADRILYGDATRWCDPAVANHLRLGRFMHLRSLTLVHFAFVSFADLILTVRAIPTLKTLRCEDAHFLPSSSLPLPPVDGDDSSLKTVSFSVGYSLAAAVVGLQDATASGCAKYSAQAFIRSGLLRSVTSLEIFHASTAIGWIPVLAAYGAQLHHIGITLHDVQLSDSDAHDDFNVFPSDRDTVVRIFNALSKCKSLRTLSIRYDAEDTLTARLVDMWTPSTDDGPGPLISSYFLDEAVRLLSGAYGEGLPPALPFPSLQRLELKLIATVGSLRSCTHACTALAAALTIHDYPEFSQLLVEIEEPGGVFVERETGEAACSRKAAAVRTELFSPFEDTGIALDVIVLERSE